MLLMLIFQISPCSPCLLVPINKGNKGDKTRPNHKCSMSNSLPRGPQKKPGRKNLTDNYGLCKTSCVTGTTKPPPLAVRPLCSSTGVHLLDCTRAPTKGSERTLRDLLVRGWNTTTSGMGRGFCKTSQYFRAQVQSIELKHQEE